MIRWNNKLIKKVSDEDQILIKLLSNKILLSRIKNFKKKKLKFLNNSMMKIIYSNNNQKNKQILNLLKLK